MKFEDIKNRFKMSDLTTQVFYDFFKEHENKLIAEFRKFLRVLHDHTFNPLKAQENLNWIRYEIEKRLKSDE